MVNKVLLVGNLGADPETRHSQNGSAITSFRMATTETWKKQDGSREEQVEWHRVTAFGRLAEICGEYLSKGSKVFIEGRIQTNTYEKNGEKRYSTEIIAREMKMLSPRGQANDPPFPAPGSGGIGDDVPF